MNRLLLGFLIALIATPYSFADGGGTASRVIPTSKSDSDGARSTTAAGRTSGTVRTRTASTGTTTPNVVRVGARVLNMGGDASHTQSVASRTNTISRSADIDSARGNLDSAVNTVGRNARVSAASINNNPALRRAGITLRPTVAEVGGRAKIGGTDIQTGSNIDNSARSVTARATTTLDAESIEQAKTRLEQTADLNKSCQEQYNDCMDQFCAVIDSNQKRCSCSANLSKYTKVETAVKDANTQLNDVAQRIRYVGLSADEIRSIMTETEAEEALSGSVDNSETRSMLDEIEKLIKDPTSSSSYSSGSTSFGLDMDFDFSSDSTDLFNLDFLGGDSGSFSNLRGTELYNAAKKRCNTVLTQCKEVGATTQQITGNYDLAIDKDCIAYEQGLKKMNETLVSNVRSANNMLQKARLAVLQNKNQYDAKGCVAALDDCMTDDMVCGSDYAKCLDPTKRYIDENGEVVLGQRISDITAFMENYNNAAINSSFISSAYLSQSINTTACMASPASGQASGGNDGSCVVKYLMQKIGTKQKVTDEGLCRAVLEKCQAYTYDSNDNYKPYNDIVVNYVQRAMVNIKAAQHQAISDYASNCMVDIAQCYNQQVTQVNAWSSNANVSSIYNVMRGACRNVALTCAYAVFDGDTTGTLCNADDTCINSISEMFYQSLLCPEDSHYERDLAVSDERYINDICACDTGFVYHATTKRCLEKCVTGASYNSAGVCICNDTGLAVSNGTCSTASTVSEDTL